MNYSPFKINIPANRGKQFELDCSKISRLDISIRSRLDNGQGNLTLEFNINDAFFSVFSPDSPNIVNNFPKVPITIENNGMPLGVVRFDAVRLFAVTHSLDTLNLKDLEILAYPRKSLE